MASWNYIDLVSTTATVVTIIQFLSGISICQKIYKQGSTGDISGLPFVVGSFSTSIWLLYSYLLPDKPMGITNIIGLTLQVFYLLIYLRFCVAVPAIKTLNKQIFLFGTSAIAIFYYALVLGDPKNTTENVGLICCLASISFSMSPMASLREVIAQKSTAMLPFQLLLSMFFVGGLWGLYGLMLDNSYIAIPNIIVFAIAGLQLLLFLVYPHKNKEYAVLRM